MDNKKKKTKGTPDAVDVHVGQRLRVRRSLMGLSQEKLAEAVGLTFQQIQKYERGMNRISAGRLYQFSEILGVPVSYFYDQISGRKTAHPLQQAGGLADNEQEAFGTEDEDLLNRKETLALVKVYYSVEDPAMRKDIIRFIKSMAGHLS
jgi:transcriptional regulator with XRE-family HTH domain